MIVSPDQRRPEPLNSAGSRVDAIDRVRGIAIVLMVLHHVRDHFSSARFDPGDMTQTNVPLFLTRWVTHLCAPAFFCSRA
jgi:uncharacterized membrane protein